ncbi:uncharacterized protein F5Z01DRAFT_509701 [Emericellopsis atlantica]|uniref:Uncharacterized protein n=1 Tax=Emericellopsis atlantica TaxID=2614577 RepID=A0A9P7ZQU5_9HYPO|nr:uncharacterized protein F5Z01DRAFT_509701 [Emericellopsis atlantica]KAG9256421.1 hypothetical protein F5Z01DRAFT_509701 [Emericellopsis atlantica]
MFLTAKFPLNMGVARSLGILILSIGLVPFARINFPQSRQADKPASSRSCCCAQLLLRDNFLPCPPKFSRITQKKGSCEPARSPAHCQWQSDPQTYGTCFSHARACKQASKQARTQITTYYNKPRKGGRVK